MAKKQFSGHSTIKSTSYLNKKKNDAHNKQVTIEEVVIFDILGGLDT